MMNVTGAEEFAYTILAPSSSTPEYWLFVLVAKQKDYDKKSMERQAADKISRDLKYFMLIFGDYKF